MQLPVFHLAGLEQHLRGRLLFTDAKKNALRGRGHAGGGISALGLLPRKLSIVPAGRATFQRRIFVAAVLQLFIAVSMIVLVLEEIRYKN